LIWLALVAVVFVAGGVWFVAKSMLVRGVVLVAGLAAVGAYFLLGKSSMADQPLEARIVQIQKQWDDQGPQTLRADQIMALAEKRAREEPNNPGPHLAIGTLLELVGRPEEAMMAYESALRRSPDEIEAIKKLADLRFKMTQEIDPVTSALYHEWYRREPNQLRVGYLAGIGDWLEGKKAEAETIWADVEAKSPPPEVRGMYLALRQMYGIDPAPAEPSKPPG
jgi:cytochrome c-type biogenesis protein CcmH/NrfG